MRPMSRRARQLLRDALALPLSERAQVVADVFAGIDRDDAAQAA